MRAWFTCGVIALAVLLLQRPIPAVASGGTLEVLVVDEQTGQPIACRMHLKASNNRPRRVGKLPYWHDHFVFPGKVELELPRGDYTFVIERGPEYVLRSGHFTIENFANDTQSVTLKRYVNMANEGWWCGDLDIRRPLKDIELLMQAEDLHVAPVITWDHKQTEWTGRRLPDEPLVRFDGNRYYHQMAGADERGGGPLFYFNLLQPLKLAGATREYPSPITFLEQARERDNVWVDVSKPFAWDLPLWVASGQVDSIGLANSHLCRDKMIEHEAGGKPRDARRLRNPWGNGLWSQEIYYHLLNCGLRIPPSAGSGSGDAPNPVGYNRVYVHCGDEFSYDAWWEGLRAGRVVVTNGPLIRPEVNGELPGHVFHAEAGEALELEIALNLGTRDRIHYLEVVRNGRVEYSVRLEDFVQAGKLPPLSIKESGWFLIRAVTETEATYRYASTGPYYVETTDTPRRISRESAQFFLDWGNEQRERIKLDDPQQREEVLRHHEMARRYWEDLVSQANAE